MIHNRDAFLQHVAQRLGRQEIRRTPITETPVNRWAQTRLTDLTSDEREQKFIATAQKVMLAETGTVKAADAPKTIAELCKKYGAGDVILSADARLSALGVTPAALSGFTVKTWDPHHAQEGIAFANTAKVGVVYCEYGLTESGSVVLYSSPEQSRSLSLLPESSIFVLAKSSILPRPAQLAQVLHEKAQRGERMPSCINLIGGPSSTADIELVKCVGVHGPIHAYYLILEDR